LQTPETTFLSSRLLWIEAIRVLRRDGRSLAEGAPLLDRVGMSVMLATHDATMAEVAGHLGLKVVDLVAPR